jgi:hypothetical protein
MHGRCWSCVSLLALWTLVGACGDGGKATTSDKKESTAKAADDGAVAKADDGNENADDGDGKAGDDKAAQGDAADDAKAPAEGEGGEPGEDEGEGEGEGEGAEGEPGEGAGEAADEGEPGEAEGDAAGQGEPEAAADPKELLKQAKSKKTKDDEALELLTQAEELGAKVRDVAKAAKERGDALFADAERSKKFYEWAAEKDKKYPDPYFAMAKQAVNLGEIDETKRLLKLVHERKGKKLLQQIQFDAMWEIVKDDPEVRGWYGG